MENTKLLFFDTETTGLKSDTEDILQLSIIDKSGEITVALRILIC